MGKREKRVDPVDGVAYTFDELKSYYSHRYALAHIKAYWEDKCTSTKAQRRYEGTRKTNNRQQPKKVLGLFGTEASSLVFQRVLRQKFIMHTILGNLIDTAACQYWGQFRFISRLCHQTVGRISLALIIPKHFSKGGARNGHDVISFVGKLGKFDKVEAFYVAQKYSSSRDRSIRWGGVVALGNLASQCELALNALIPFLEHDDEVIHHAVFNTLCELKRHEPLIALLLARLQNDSSTRRSTLNILMHVSGKGDIKVLNRLITLLSESGATVRKNAIWALSSLATENDASSTSALIPCLEDEAVEVRCAAVSALNKFRINEDHLRSLFRSLCNGRSCVCECVAQVLRNSSHDFERLVKTLIGFAAVDGIPSAALIGALRSVVIEGASVIISACCKCLLTAATAARQVATCVLRHFSNKDDVVVVRALIGSLEDNDLGVRRAASEALCQMTTAGNVKAACLLIIPLFSGERSIQREAVRAMSHLLCDGVGVISLLRSRCTSEEERERAYQQTSNEVRWRCFCVRLFGQRGAVT
eukprot:TRINITY_DN27788_c0_g1_i1.p1 TRINITY_DN27788_c0_g1~~TRINITY_DN27788_c0_g1_i1.p1  ORF type:complete len:532 (-),score=41.26 TRINITY_DN27788_c0_g1_i1:145-1740(-)